MWQGYGTGYPTKRDGSPTGISEEKVGEIRDAYHLSSLLKFSIGEYELIVFPDGRAFIKGCTDEKIAKSLYSKYIGV